MSIDLNDYRARKAAAMAYHPSVRPIWTPADSVATAQAFAAELAHAERGHADKPRWTAKMFGRSRFRRAKVYDGLAVTLLLILSAAFGVILMLLAAPTAKAEPSDAAVEYAQDNGRIACSVLSDYPTVNGLLGVMQGIVEHGGWSPFEAGQITAMSVDAYCPQHLDLLDLFVQRYESRSVA